MRLVRVWRHLRAGGVLTEGLDAHCSQSVLVQKVWRIRTDRESVWNTVSARPRNPGIGAAWTGCHKPAGAGVETPLRSTVLGKP